MNKIEELIDAMDDCRFHGVICDNQDECKFRGVGCIYEIKRNIIQCLRNKESCGTYWENICKLNARQEIKGKNKYGMSLDENTDMNIFQRIEYLQEELVDALKYCEHIKAMLRDIYGSEDNTK